MLFFVITVGGRRKRSKNERASGRRRNFGGKVSGMDDFTISFQWLMVHCTNLSLNTRPWMDMSAGLFKCILSHFDSDVL